MKRIHVKISGRVQGVCFRMYTEIEAKKHNLTGWVRNLPDNIVEIVAEGSDSAVEEFLTWVHTGPSAARVQDVKYQEEPVSGKHTSFVIRY